MSDLIQRKLVKQTAIDYMLYLPALLTTGVMGMLTVTVLSKVFTPAEYGRYALASKLLLLLSMVTSLWLRGSVLRLVPQYQRTNQLRELFGTLTLAGGIVLALVLLLVGLGLVLFRSVWDAETYRLFWIALVGVPLMTVFTTVLAAYRITGRVALYSAETLIRVVGGFLVGLLLAVPLRMGPAGMIIGMVGVLALAVLGQLAGNVKRMAILAWPPRIDWTILRDMAAYNIPIVLVNVAATIYSEADRYLIDGYFSSYEVGIYTVSYTIAEGIMRTVSKTLLITAEPIIFNAWEASGSTATYRFIESFFRYYLLMSLPLLVGMSVMRKEIVTLFSTAEYVRGSITIVYVGLALFLHGYALIAGTIFDATKRTTIPLVNSIIAALFNLGANIILLPRFGYQAAAWTTLASYGLLAGLTITAARRLAPLRFVEPYLWKVLLATAGMAGVVAVLRPVLADTSVGLSLAVLAGIGVYSGLALALGAVTIQERRGLGNRIGRFAIQLKTILSRG